jgi:hypothetical protein
LLAEYSVLLGEILDDLPLAAVDPPGHGENAELEDKTVHPGERSASPAGAQEPADFRAETARFAPDEFWDRTGGDFTKSARFTRMVELGYLVK